MSKFTKEYWKSATSELKSVKTIALASVFIALQIAITSVYIPVPALGTQKIFFSFIVVSLGCYIYGPVVGMVAGGVGDILGYIIHPQGDFFIGYTITSVLSGLIYGLFLYKSRISIFRLTLCKFSINLFLNTLLNALWMMIVYKTDYIASVISRTPKNLVILPIEIIMMYVVFSRIVPILRKENIIKHEGETEKVKWF